MTSFHHSSATYLYDHVQEWHGRRSTCEAPPFEDCVDLDLFLRILLAPIGKDVASHFPQTEEEALQTTLRFDLIYAQSGYVYTIIRGLPHPGSANALGESNAADSVIGTLSHPFPYTQQSYGHPQGGTSSSNTYAPPAINMFLGPQPIYQTIAPPYE